MNSRRVYWVPAVFAIWFLVFRFRVNFPNLILCSIASGTIYYLSGALGKTSDTPPAEDTSRDWDLAAVIELVRKQADAIRGTELELSVLGILDNLRRINDAAQDVSPWMQSTYLRRFCGLYAEYSRGLIAEYLSLAGIANPSGNIEKTRRLYVERFETLCSVTGAILDDFYGGRTMDLEAENTALEQVFAPLTQEGGLGAAETQRVKQRGAAKRGKTHN